MPSAQINQPSNQIRLTNVSLVRMKKGKKRYEIACYKNTVTSFRAGHETNLDDVLQIPNVFVNVSKGQVAPNDDLKKSFPGMTRDEVVLEILTKGEIQVGEKERGQELERVHKEVIDIVAGRLVDPKSKRVYTSGMIEKALDQLSSQGGHAGRAAGKPSHASNSANTSQSRDRSAATAQSDSGANTPSKDSSSKDGELNLPIRAKPLWTGVTTSKSAKSQALDAMKALIAAQPIPVARARMRLRITCPTSIAKQSVKISPAADASEPPPPPPAAKSKGKAKGKTKNDVSSDEDGPMPERKSVKELILGYIEQVEAQDVVGEEWEVTGFVEPGSFKGLGEFISKQTKGRARAEVLDMAVTHEQD